MTDIRVSGFDESVIKDELIAVVTDIGGCLASDVRISPFRPMRNGLNLAWVRCPLVATIKIVKKGKLGVGWSLARVEMMRSRPVQCFKCWHFGHVRNRCESATDRSNHCFKCGNPEHTSYNCMSEPYSVICADLGHKTAHRIGSSACAGMTKGGGALSKPGSRDWNFLFCYIFTYFLLLIYQFIYIVPDDGFVFFGN